MYESGDEDDALDVALKRVREIPLEQYLSQEKAAKVRKARESKVLNKDQNRKRRVNSDGNGTRHAESRFNMSKWSKLDVNEQRQYVQD